jgi:hypothetical protein
MPGVVEAAPRRKGGCDRRSRACPIDVFSEIAFPKRFPETSHWRGRNGTTETAHVGRFQEDVTRSEPTEIGSAVVVNQHSMARQLSQGGRLKPASPQPAHLQSFA